MDICTERITIDERLLSLAIAAVTDMVRVLLSRGLLKYLGDRRIVRSDRTTRFSDHIERGSCARPPRQRLTVQMAPAIRASVHILPCPRVLSSQQL